MSARESLTASPPQKRPLRQEVAEIVRAARALVGAHERRNPTSDYATLGEEEALMFLRERLDSVERRVKRRA